MKRYFLIFYRAQVDFSSRDFVVSYSYEKFPNEKKLLDYLSRHPKNKDLFKFQPTNILEITKEDYDSWNE